MKNLKVFNKFLSNEDGVAFLFVITSIAVLITLVYTFQFETQIFKNTVYNSQEKQKARLAAESGLNIAISRLNLYKDAYNTLQTNKDFKDFVTIESLNMIWSTPFIYPFPNINNSIKVKSALESFNKDNLLDESMKISVSIQSYSNRLNLNMLDLSVFKTENKQKNKNTNSNDSNEDDDEDDESGLFVEKELERILNLAVDRKREEDESFAIKYSNFDAKLLISSIKHYIIPKNKFTDSYTSEIESILFEKGQKLKHKPLQSLTEINALPGWDQEIIELIKNDITVHGGKFIDLNKINENVLNFLLPSLEEEQIKEFFEYRDNPDKPVIFNNLEEFKNFIVKEKSYISEIKFDERLKKFEQNGINFGTSGSLFHVESSGSYNDAIFKINAFVLIPVKIPFKEEIKKQSNVDQNSDNENPNETENEEDKIAKEDEINDQNNQDNSNKEETKEPNEMKTPRVVELWVD